MHKKVDSSEIPNQKDAKHCSPKVPQVTCSITLGQLEGWGESNERTFVLITGIRDHCISRVNTELLEGPMPPFKSNVPNMKVDNRDLKVKVPYHLNKTIKNRLVRYMDF